ncbi:MULTISPECIES: hypothetical protein [Mameliella]|uniref:hypothetical protein n=1 Tax=Mameliella TaxID=1434019 RepID=UPI000B5364CC|nr:MULTISPECIES: hypothetical protein [Mameliella]MCR9274226.1 hypothetical protein [Paracoccaceae bacterium]OWV54456.1 hypothetical protein CDZ98_20990 [Mameliella alba]
MSVHFDPDQLHDDTPAVLNVFSILVLNILCITGMGIAAQVAGLHWAWVLATAWVGGAVVTVALILTLAFILPTLADRRPARFVRTETPTLDEWQADAQDLLDLWAADVRAEKAARKARNAATTAEEDRKAA